MKFFNVLFNKKLRLETPKKILVVRPDAIGDVVLMIPLLNSIKKQCPEVDIYTLQQAYTHPLLNNHSSVYQVLLDWRKAGKVRSMIDFFRYVRYIRSFHFDMVIFSYIDFFMVFLSFLARIPVRIGDANKVFLRLFLSRPVVQPFRSLLLHEVEQNLELLKGFSDELSPCDDMNLICDSSTLDKASQLLKEHGWGGGDLIGIHPSTGGGNRSWTSKRYAQLIDLIGQQSSCQVVLTGSGSREELVNQEIQALSEVNIIDLTNHTDLELLKGVIQCCKVFVGTDTGPTHMAAALKIPVLSISPTKFVKSLRWGPWKTVNHIAGKPQFCDFICNPYECNRPDCLDALESSYVFSLLQDLITGSYDMPQVMGFLEKEEWFLSSINMMVYVSDFNDSLCEKLNESVAFLKTKGMRFVVVCSSSSIKNQISKEIEIEAVIARYQFFKLCRFIWKKDINLIHLFPFTLGWFWRGVVRQCVAPRLYCPPQIMGGQDFSDSSARLHEYMKLFK